MSHSNYEIERGAIEAGQGFDGEFAPAQLSEAQQIALLTRHNQELAGQVTELKKNLHRLRAELAECQRREAFLADALQSIRHAAQPAEDDWETGDRWGRAPESEPEEPADSMMRRIGDIIADSWREPRWKRC
jgi:hypothetical protein